MAFNARVLTVLIASPGDVTPERDAVEEEVSDWNRQHWHSADRVRLEVRRWEHDATPELGRGDGQQVINRQLVHDSDIVIGLFHTRLGTATRRAVSGTAEELRLAAASGKAVHVYFSTKRPPYHHDPQQLQSVKEFRRLLEGEGLLDTFSKTNELRKKVARAITRDVDLLRALPVGGAPAPPARRLGSMRELLALPTPAGVHLDMHFEITGPAHNEYTRRVWIENAGDVDARSVKVLLDPGSEKLEEVFLIACPVKEVPAGKEVLFELPRPPKPPATLIVRWQEPRGEQRKTFVIPRKNPLAI